MRRLLLAIAALSLIAVTGAQAATVNVVKGAGFGHGVGMSQYGAYGFAQRGTDYDRILAHYYTGTKLGRASSQPVRVLLQASDPFVRVKGATNRLGSKRLSPSRTYVVRRSSTGLAVTSGGKRVGTYDSPIRFKGGKRGIRLLGAAINGLSSGRYRGTMELRRGAAGGVTAINSLGVDPYVKGVVAAEMPSTWHSEALKAQSVAARTYALATDKPGVFDQYPDTRSQVYRGIAAETSRTNSAVAATAREIVTYRGEIATTFFFSTSGGRTENVENSFLGSKPQPYLKSVRDPYDRISPKHRWRLRFTNSQLGSRLGAPGSFRRVQVIKRGSSPRIVRARVVGSRGSRVLTGPSIRAKLGLFDTWASFTKVSTSRARGARAAANHSASLEIAGTFTPAPAKRTLELERRRGKRWVRAGTVQTARSGRFRKTVLEPGTYRVKAAGIAGPAVRLG